MSTENSKCEEKVTSGLGRPTKRGVRKCFKCGIYNGTRGFTCKNKQCEAVLRDVEKRKVNLDAVKLTGTTKQVYSVKVKDKGPDYRGFVQLPLIYSKGETEETITEVAICFVDSCQRLFDDSILKCHEAEPTAPSTFCMHIDSALKSSHVATPLLFKQDVINLLTASDEVKGKLWTLAGDSGGVMVQRVSKSVMVVKCQVSPKHPFGYLHLTFLTSKGKETFDKFLCSCDEFRGAEMRENKCVHYYACIASLASDIKYIDEFKVFINLEYQLVEEQLVSRVLGISTSGFKSIQTNLFNYPEEIETSQAIPSTNFTNYGSQHKNMDCNLVMTTLFDTFNSGSNLGNTTSQTGIENENLNLETLNCSDSYRQNPNNYQGGSYETRSYANSSRVNLDQELSKKNLSKPHSKTRKGKRGFDHGDFISFTDWLSSITERINETMHYSCSGTPDPLVFHIPLKFFELLRERLSSSSSKMRLPNVTERFVRKDKPPVGMFYKYSWHITNILHVKQMFDTPEVSLDIIKHFILNKEGEFIECIGRALEKGDGNGCSPPLRYTTYLKVGIFAREQKEPIPFIIEWVPNFLRVSNFGEMKLIFQFGHQHSDGK